MNAKTYQKLLFCVLSLVCLLPFIQSVVLTVTAREIMADMQLNPQEMGLLGAFFLFSYAVCMLSSGMLSTFFGPRKTLAAFLIIAGIGGVIFSLSQSLAIACLGRAMTGLGTAICIMPSFSLFARWFKAESYPKVTGFLFAIGGTGGFLGAGPLAILTGEFGWRWCYGGLGLLTLLFAVLIFAVIRDWPTADVEKELGISASPRNPVTPGMMLEGLQALSMNRDFWRLVLWFCAMASISQPFINLWAAPYFKDVFGLNEAWAGLAVSLFSVGFIVGNPLVSWLCVNRLHSNRIPLGAAGIGAGICFLPLFVLSAYLDRWGVLILSLLLGIFVNSLNTVVYASARNLFGARWASVSSGLISGMSLVTGAVMQLVVSGLLSYGVENKWHIESAYLLAFSSFIPACAVMAYCGFTLTRASDPGRVSPSSWRAVPRKPEQ